MKFKFKISEFFKEQKPLISLEIADKILVHIGILTPVRDILNSPIYISQNSGYRSFEYEKLHGRSGKSEHVFRGGGAVDLTCDPEKMREMIRLLRMSDYRRVCYYPENNFVHCDLKRGKKKYYTCLPDEKWQLESIQA
ncbi:MAG: hypothetical protein GQ468_02855 [Candidatus Scalindua sp.]|nr:hypothetical protein [Candidatus Scalindua sp.]